LHKFQLSLGFFEFFDKVKFCVDRLFEDFSCFYSVSFPWVKFVFNPIVLNVLLTNLNFSGEQSYILGASCGLDSYDLFWPIPLLKHGANHLVSLLSRQLHIDAPYGNRMCRHEFILETYLWSEFHPLHQVLTHLHDYDIEG
jgi:hypothetical protein